MGIMITNMKVKGRSIEIRKPTTVIHIDRRELTLLQQKLFNVILWDFYQQSMPENESDLFVVEMKKINKLLHYDKRKDKNVIKNLKQLSKLEISWGLDGKEGSSMGFTRFIGSAGIVNGYLEYTVPFHARKILLDRDVYDMISVTITSLFRSKYAEALYEVCHRHLGIGHTGRWTLDLMRRELGIKAEHKNFADERRKIIEPAMREVNELSDIEVRAEYYHHGRKVMGVDFFVKERPKIKKPPRVKVEDRPRGVTKTQAEEAAILDAQSKEIIDIYEEMPGPNRREFEKRVEAVVKNDPLLGPYFRKKGIDTFLVQTTFKWFEKQEEFRGIFKR